MKWAASLSMTKTGLAAAVILTYGALLGVEQILTAELPGPLLDVITIVVG